MVEKISKEHMREYLELFALFDEDEEGVVQTSDLGKMFHLLGQDTSEDDIAEYCREIDPDEKGTIDWDTFLLLMARKRKRLSAIDEVRQAFRVFDKLGTGIITAAELRHIMVNLGDKLNEQEIEEILLDADTKGDGEIHYEDFITMMTQN